MASSSVFRKHSLDHFCSVFSKLVFLSLVLQYRAKTLTGENVSEIRPTFCAECDAKPCSISISPSACALFRERREPVSRIGVTAQRDAWEASTPTSESVRTSCVFGLFQPLRLVNRINAFLRRMQRFGYLQSHITVAELMNKYDHDLFVNYVYQRML